MRLRNKLVNSKITLVQRALKIGKVQQGFEQAEETMLLLKQFPGAEAQQVQHIFGVFINIVDLAFFEYSHSLNAVETTVAV